MFAWAGARPLEQIFQQVGDVEPIANSPRSVCSDQSSPRSVVSIEQLEDLREELARVESACGPDSLEVASELESLSHMYGRVRRPHTQVRLLNRAIKIRGIADPRVALLMENCLRASRAQGRRARRRELLRLSGDEPPTAAAADPGEKPAHRIGSPKQDILSMLGAERRTPPCFLQESSGDAWRDMQGFVLGFGLQMPPHVVADDAPEPEIDVFSSDDDRMDESTLLDLPEIVVEWPIWCTIEVVSYDSLVLF